MVLHDLFRYLVLNHVVSESAQWPSARIMDVLCSVVSMQCCASIGPQGSVEEAPGVRACGSLSSVVCPCTKMVLLPAR
jgi:hypothetical protein